MGRKIKAIVLLVVLLVMIYCQQATIYAEKSDVSRSKSGKHASQGQEKDIDGIEEIRRGEDNKGGNGSKEEDYGEGGNGEEGNGEGSNGEGSNGEGSNGAGSSGGGSSGEEGSEGEGGGEDEEGKGEGGGEEENLPLRKYRLVFPEPDGENGYYITVPKIEISHTDSRGNTKYSLTVNGTVKAEGTLDSSKDCVALAEGELEEGENILTVYMEDEGGTRPEEYNCTQIFHLDLTNPQFEMYTAKGFGVWHQKEAWIDVTADDGKNGSQVASISCYCENQIIGTVKESYAGFLINRACDNGEGLNVTVAVTDAAGRKSEGKRRVYIDNSAPQTVIAGVEDYMITSKAVEAVFQVREDNGLKASAAEVEWEGVSGDRQTIPVDTWREEKGGREASFTLAEDGIYRMKVSAVDLAGYRSEEEAQVIIDSHNPVIRYVDGLDGKYMKKFCWNYSKDEFIEDFTSYVHQIELDGELYPAGKETVAEGVHVLKVEAVDSAGNKAEARAQFVIDHTPPEVLFLAVEENQVYEGERTFKIVLKNPEDEIQEIKINGSPQPVKKGKTAYQYTVQEPSDYEVSVKARDKAGNYTNKDIVFEVAPEETMLQKAVKPVKRLFSGSREIDRKTKDSGRAKAEERRVWKILAALSAGAAVCGAAGVILWKKAH